MIFALNAALPASVELYGYSMRLVKAPGEQSKCGEIRSSGALIADASQMKLGLTPIQRINIQFIL
jgi:hypothetical protein